MPPKLVKDARIVALGAYEAGEPLAFSFAGQGDEVGRVSVLGRNDGDPILLVLSAYDPVIWDMTRFPLKRLRGLVVYGYHDQAVAGVPDRIPVRFAVGSGTSPCGAGVYAYKESAELQQLRAQVRVVLGRDISEFHGAYDPTAFNIDGGEVAPGPRPPLTLSGVRGSAPLVIDRVAPGEAGLAQLLAAGDIRPATQRDVAAWNAAAARAHPERWFQRGSSTTLSRDLTYVVLRGTELPKGMHGAHSRSFIVPAGVPRPIDPGSHNQYFWADGSCGGPGC